MDVAMSNVRSALEASILSTLLDSFSSSTATRSARRSERMHIGMLKAIESAVGREVVYDTEYGIDQDLFGKPFNIDLGIRTRQDATREDVPDLLVLAKHPVSSINKNRFNFAQNRIGESARVMFSCNSRLRPGLTLLHLDFVPERAPVLDRGGAVKAFERVEMISSKDVLSAQYNNNANGSSVLEVAVTYRINADIEDCADKAAIHCRLAAAAAAGQPVLQITDDGKFTQIVREIFRDGRVYGRKSRVIAI